MERCKRCRSSKLSISKINHVVELQGGVVIIRNVPAYVCPSCGEGRIIPTHARKVDQLVHDAIGSEHGIIVINYDNFAA